VPISLIKKKFTGRDPAKAKLENYTLAVRVARPFAPAAIQADTSFFILATMVGTEDSCLLRTLAFLSSQISQVMSRAMDLVALRGKSVAAVRLHHH
jgi:hypothetical protein